MNYSPLHKLSPELRNQIYFHVFFRNYAVPLSPATAQHPLTQTCRQLRHETLSMFHANTAFNAHLEDVPADKLVRWCSSLDAEMLLCSPWIGLCGLHGMHGTMYGEEATKRLLSAEPDEGTGKYVLRRVDGWVSAPCGFGRDLKDVMLGLQRMGLGLLRFCIVGKQEAVYNAAQVNELAFSTGNGCASGAMSGKCKLTSKFAIVKIDDWPERAVFGDGTTSVDRLADAHGLSERARAELLRELAGKKTEVESGDDGHEIVVDYNSIELRGRPFSSETVLENCGFERLRISIDGIVIGRKR